MTLIMYSIFDRVAEEFGPIMCCKNDAVAVRAYKMALKDSRPDDFRLYAVGSFDNSKGVVVDDAVREVFSGEEVKDV